MSKEKLDHQKYSFFNQFKPVIDKFGKALPQNVALALITVPAERISLERIVQRLNNPTLKPTPYRQLIQDIGFKNIWAGSTARVSYFLTGNMATLLGIHYFGSDYKGLAATTVAKNMILPMFSVSNARQLNYNWMQTYEFTMKSICDPVVHSSFFLRNLLANSCLLPGFALRDYCYQNTNMSASNANILGWGTSLTASSLFNALLKAMITGNYPLNVRWQVAKTLPAKLSLAIREAASLTIVFSNTTPKPRIENPPESAQRRLT